MSSTSNTKKMSKTEEDKTNIQAFIFFLIALFVLNKLFNVPFNPVIAVLTLTYLIGTKYMDNNKNIFFPAEIEEEYVIPPKQEKDD